MPWEESGSGGSTVYRTAAVRPGDEPVVPSERSVACASCGRWGAGKCARCERRLSIPACLMLAVGMTFVMEVVGSLVLERSAWLAALPAQDRGQWFALVMGLCMASGGVAAFVVARSMRLLAYPFRRRRG